MKHYSEMSLQEYNNLKSLGLLWVYFPEATGNPDEDLQAVVRTITQNFKVTDSEFIKNGPIKYFYDIIDEEAEYEF